MRVALDVNGTELAVLYILTGNKDAGELLRRAIAEERLKNPPKPPVRKGRPSGSKNESK